MTVESNAATKPSFESLTSAEVRERLEKARDLLPMLESERLTFGSDYSGACAAASYYAARNALREALWRCPDAREAGR